MKTGNSFDRNMFTRAVSGLFGVKEGNATIEVDVNKALEIIPCDMKQLEKAVGEVVDLVRTKGKAEASKIAKTIYENRDSLLTIVG